jgi:hypothetical protein
MKTFAIAMALSAALVTPALSVRGTWMCQVGNEFYPVTLTDRTLTSSTITWRGKVYRNVKRVEGCKAKLTATRKGVTIEFCAATQGAADVTIGGNSYGCDDGRPLRQPEEVGNPQ